MSSNIAPICERNLATSRYTRSEKQFYQELKSLKLASTIEETFSIDASSAKLIQTIKKIIRVDDITVVKFADNEISIHSTVKEIRDAEIPPLSADLKRMKDLCEFQKLIDLTKVFPKLPTMSSVLKQYPYCFATKINGEANEVGEGAKTLIYIFHFNSASMEVILKQ